MRGQKWPNAPLTPPFFTPGAVNAALLFDLALDIAQHVHFLHKFKKKKFLKIFYFILFFSIKKVPPNGSTSYVELIMRRDGRGRKR